MERDKKSPFGMREREREREREKERALQFSSSSFPLGVARYAALLFHYIFRANRVSRDNAVHTHRENEQGEGEGEPTLIQGLMRV